MPHPTLPGLLVVLNPQKVCISIICLLLLKKSTHTVTPIVAGIVNYSLKAGVFPEALKVSRTIPEYKKGEKEMLQVIYQF